MTFGHGDFFIERGGVGHLRARKESRGMNEVKKKLLKNKREDGRMLFEVPLVATDQNSAEYFRTLSAF